MEKSNSLRPIQFCLGTELIKYDIDDFRVKLTLKLPNKIDLLELHKMLSTFFHVQHTHSYTFGDNNEFLFFYRFINNET